MSTDDGYKHLSDDEIYKNVTAASHASKQWIQPNMLEDA
jgi:hypothetical protein